MSTLLLRLRGNKSLNRTIFPPQLFVYDDLLVYKKRKLLSSKEITISYNQISQITLNKGLLFAGLDVVTTGAEDIMIKFVNKKLAEQAKKIIDQKIYHSHAKHNESAGDHKTSSIVVERALSRLNELLQRNQINQSDYDKKKKALLNQL